MANVVEILVKGKDQFSGPAKSAQTSAGGLKGAMGGLGKMALGVGAGFIAAQASIAGVQKIMSASIGAAIAYEAQMAEIRALTGATEKDTEFLTVAIKDMARAMPKSPAELGAAAYFILSSGIEDAADAADVLEVAAKASTIGLGETATVADALTTVLNAYGMSADKAGHVTDVMIEAVKQGKAEAGAFAGVLGRVVPLAAQMGISFEEVAANLATFTRLGVSADEAATGLRQVMASLLKPTTDQEEAMAELGFSAEGLRQQIKDKGLLVTLGEMMEATGDNEAAVAKLFPNIRALTSVLGTAGVQMDAYTDILGATNKATGNLDEGFGIVSDTAKFKMGVAMNELNIMLMELGEEILPAIVPAMKAVVAIAGPMAEAMNAIVEPIGAIGAAVDTAFGGFPPKAEMMKQRLLEMAANAEVTKERFIELAQEGIGLTGEEARKLAEDTTFPTQMDVWRQKAVDFGLSAEEIDKAWEKAGGNIQDEWAAIDRAIAEGDATAVAFSDQMRDEVGPTAVASLEGIEEAADEARSALTDMFRETTAEEAAAELALANLKLEAGRLENKTGDLTGAERARLDQLNNELIPAQQGNLDLLRLEKDAVEKHALSQSQALTPMEAWRLKMAGQTEQARYLAIALGEIPSTIDVKIALGLAQTAELDLIKKALGAGLPIVPSQHGYHGDVTRPTMFLAGEAGQKERVDITPGGGQAAGRTVVNHFHFEGPILGDERQAMQFARMILPEIRRQVAA